MPYRIRYYPQGVKRKSLLRKEGIQISASFGNWPSKAKAKNSKVLKDLKSHGIDARVERFKRRKK